MPIVRPDREGLSDPPPDAKVKLPRSDSYLRLSEAVSQSRASGVAPLTLCQSTSKLNTMANEKPIIKTFPDLTSTLENTNETSVAGTTPRQAEPVALKGDEQLRSGVRSTSSILNPSPSTPKSVQIAAFPLPLQDRSIVRASPSLFQTVSAVPEVVSTLPSFNALG